MYSPNCSQLKGASETGNHACEAEVCRGEGDVEEGDGEAPDYKNPVTKHG